VIIQIALWFQCELYITVRQLMITYVINDDVLLIKRCNVIRYVISAFGNDVSVRGKSEDEDNEEKSRNSTTTPSNGYNIC